MMDRVSASAATEGVRARHRDDDTRWHGCSGGSEAFSLPGNLLIDLQTHQVLIDLCAPEALSTTVARHSRVAEIWLDTSTPTVTLVRRGRGDKVKRAFDVTLVVLTTPLWLPLLAMLALVVKCTSRGPAFYVHRRLGQGGRPLRCPKLRTMVVDADQSLELLLETNPELRREFDERFKLRCDPRVTRVGRVLRATGLDELPQLWFVLAGAMSWVGPRPIVSEEAEYFGPYLPIVQSVRPGLTGLWQVSGRNDIPYPERVAYEVEYVLTRGFWSDVRIIVATFVLMVRPRGRGAY